MQAEVQQEKPRTLGFSQGALPGLQAGALMFLVTAIVSLGQRYGALTPLQQLAGVFLRRSGPVSGPFATIAGLLLHLAFSALLGGIFAHAVGRVGRVRQLGTGLAYSILLWGVTQFGILPLLASSLAVQPALMWPLFLGHVAYGLMLGALVPTGGDIDEHRRNCSETVARAALLGVRSARFRPSGRSRRSPSPCCCVPSFSA